MGPGSLSNNFGCQKTFFKKVLAKPARLPYSNFSREGAQRRSKLGLRLVVGQRILVPSTGVRLSQSQPFATSTHMARSSSGLGRRPLKAEITSSNLVRATMSSSGRTSKAPLHMARSSSGSGRRPLKAEITSSNLVRATKSTPASLQARRFFLPRSAETARDPPPCAPNAFNELNITCLIPPCFARMPSS